MAIKRASDFTEILIRRRIISPEQLEEAREMAEKNRLKLAEALVRLGYASGEEVMRAVAEQHGREYINLHDVVIPPTVLELVPESVARENVVLPLAEEDGTLKVIVSDPTDYETLSLIHI